MSLRLDLPVLQNWDCHNCGGCCRQHQIEITAEERQRILDQKWSSSDDVSGSPIVRFGGWLQRPRYRLAHRADGACVFLDERGLCRIHAKFGESAKPLACRVYPYVFHPAGKSVAVSLRFSCPSVVRNAGRSLKNRPEIRQIADQVVPPTGLSAPAPFLNQTEQVSWPDFHRFIQALDQSLADESSPLLTRLLRALLWTSLVGQSTFSKLKGDRLGDFLEMIREAAVSEIPDTPATYDEPTSLGRLYFRLLVAQYARKDTAADLAGGWSGRWKLLRAVWRFSRGEGEIPPPQDVFRAVPFSALDGSFGELSVEQVEIFTRYFRVKIQGLHFCGPAYYDVPFVEGFQSLMLVLPSTMWIARWLAVSENRSMVSYEDVVRALAIVDHHHGFSPALGQAAARRRVRTLAQSGDLTRLLLKYSR